MQSQQGRGSSNAILTFSLKLLKSLGTEPVVELTLDQLIWENLRAKEKTLRTAECLAKHDIGPDHRAKMVSWMIEVLSDLGCATQALFLSARYLDLYFKRHKTALPLSQLHKAGATALLLASKFEDVTPIPLQKLHEDIVHKAFTADQLKKSELKMLKVLDFDLDVPTTLDFLGYLIDKLEVNRVVSHVAVNVAVITMINYNGLRFLPSLQGTACLIIAGMSTRQSKLISQVLKLTGYLQSDMLPVLEWMHSAVVDFPMRYPKLTGPLECLHCTIVGKTPGPLFRFDDEEMEAAHQALLAHPRLA